MSAGSSLSTIPNTGSCMNIACLWPELIQKHQDKKVQKSMAPRKVMLSRMSRLPQIAQHPRKQDNSKRQCDTLIKITGNRTHRVYIINSTAKYTI